MDKEIILQAYNLLAEDSEILSLLGLQLSVSPLLSEYQEIDRRIGKTKQVVDVVDGKPRLAIWIHSRTPHNRRVSNYTLEIDILVPLPKQKSTGLALTLGNRIQEVFKDVRFGIGTNNIGFDSDLKTAFGWYKAAVKISYNAVN